MTRRRWYKPWTWGKRRETAKLGGDPFYQDEPRVGRARPMDLSPESSWRNRGADLRARSREACRRDPHAASIRDKIAGNLVGKGIRPTPNDRSDGRKRRLTEAWEDWAPTAFVGGWSIGAGQAQAADALVESGEVLLWRQWRDDIPGVPMRVKLLEGDMLDDSMPDEIRNDGSRRVGGIEMDRHGERVAYWIRREHPGSQGLTAGAGWLDSFKVPAADIAHLFVPRRPGQQRGFPFLSPVLDDLAELDDYEIAEATRKTLDSCIMAFVRPGANVNAAPGLGGKTVTPAVKDAHGNPVAGLMQGAIVELADGKEVTMHSPAATQGYEEYKRSKLRSIGAGVGVMYEHIAADLSTVNYSSYRAGHIEFRRMIEGLREHYVIPRMLLPVWAWFVEAAFVAGMTDRPTCPVTWHAPRWQSVDPKKDADADIAEVEAGFALQSDKIAERGRDPVKFLEEYAAWEKKKDAAIPTTPEEDERAAAAFVKIFGHRPRPAAGGPPADTARRGARSGT